MPEAERRRRNDTLILLKIQNLDDKFAALFVSLEKALVEHTARDHKEHILMEKELTDHIAQDKEEHVKVDHLLHGNGSVGMKTSLEIVKTRVTLLSAILFGAWGAIVSSYIKLRGM